MDGADEEETLLLDLLLDLLFALSNARSSGGSKRLPAVTLLVTLPATEPGEDGPV